MNKIGSMEEQTKVLSTLERIMYFQDCLVDEEHVLGVYRDVGNQFPNAPCFIAFLKEHWLYTVGMWCVENCNIPHASQNTNTTVESFHSNMK